MNRLNKRLGIIVSSALLTTLVACSSNMNAPPSQRQAETNKPAESPEAVPATADDVFEMRPEYSWRRQSHTSLEEIVVTAQRAAGLSSDEAFAIEPDSVANIPFASDEELWIISQPDDPAPESGVAEPGTGAMVAHFDQQELPLPLEHTDVTAKIKGYISTVNVRQQFRNPYDSKIEAVYMFPLPEKSAITGFVMIIGERKIRGILREKEEAQRIYNEARSQGYRASLMVQHRPNIFEQRVANIEPGKSIDVDIKYFHTLKYTDGWYSFVFPTVVGPRYNPPESTDPILAVPRTDTSTSSPAVRYLPPAERSGHDVSIAVDIDAGVDIEELRATHRIATERAAPGKAKVALANEATIPNRDFVLDFRVAGEQMKTDMLTWTDPETQQGFFTMMLYPPEVTEGLRRAPMEMVFVLDTSGSMGGQPIRQAKNAVLAALDMMQPDDTFQIIRFSDNASQFGRIPVLASPRNIEKARRYLKNLDGGGGTRMIEGIRAALDFPHDPERLRFVTFLTDGYIGNEDEILSAIHEKLGASRIFSFGVGNSVNRFLMERMATHGKGAAAFLGLQDSGSRIMRDFFDRVSHPAMTDVEIDWNGMAVSDVYPHRIPDLFVGRPLVVTGKFSGAAAPVAVTGQVGGEHHRVAVAVDDSDGAGSELSKIWARIRIAELEDRQARVMNQDAELASSIRETALKYQLMSNYTSFVAVDSSARTEGTHGTTVHQAVPVPDGVQYETTVSQQ